MRYAIKRHNFFADECLTALKDGFVSSCYDSESAVFPTCTRRQHTPRGWKIMFFVMANTSAHTANMQTRD